MLKKVGKLMFAASAAAGMALIFAQAPSNAASANFCVAQARTIASESGEMGSASYQRAFNTAYAGCRGSGAGVMNSMAQNQALTAAPAPAPAAEGGGSCDFSKYHSSWDPVMCR